MMRATVEFPCECRECERERAGKLNVNAPVFVPQGKWHKVEILEVISSCSEKESPSSIEASKHDLSSFDTVMIQDLLVGSSPSSEDAKENPEVIIKPKMYIPAGCVKVVKPQPTLIQQEEAQTLILEHANSITKSASKKFVEILDSKIYRLS